MCYFPPLVCGWEWLENRRGIATGVILGAYGFSGFIFSFISLAVVNPDNIDPQYLPNGDMIYSTAIVSRVPKLLEIIALIFGILGIICILFIKRNPNFRDTVANQEID